MKLRAKPTRPSTLSTIITAVRRGNHPALRKLLARRPNLNAPGTGLPDKSVPGASPLIEAAARNDVEAATLLLDSGADVNWQVPITCGSWCNYGYSALTVAAWRGHADMVRLLLSRGADPELTASDKDLIHGHALHYAVRSRNVECVRLLVAAGANANAKSGDQKTPLQLVKGAKSVQLAEALAGKLADTNKPAQFLDACTGGNAPLVKTLLAKGADVNATDPQGDSALTNAALMGHKDVVKLLLKSGADPNLSPKRSSTALMHAAQNDWPVVVKLLLDAGADPNAISDEHQTALDVAEEWGADRCARILRKAKAKPAQTIKPRKIKIPHPMAEETPPMAKLPDFSSALRDDAYIEALKDLARTARTKPEETDIPAVYDLRLPHAAALSLFRDKQSTLLKQGFYLLFYRESQQGESILRILPTDRWEHVIAVANTAGSPTLGSRKLISKLNAIADETPFVLVLAAVNQLRARFLRKPKDPATLAKRLDQLAPDVVNYMELPTRREGLARLADIITRDRQFVLAWP